MENQLNNVSSEPKYVYVVLTEEWYGGENKKSLVKVFNSEDEAKKYEIIVGNENNLDTIVVKKMIE
jgi:ribosomal protein S24E